ncbi:MAG: hypothetical protein NXI00_24715, partial [Cytophagales bacterium]|nr:hypothetical protein [Cytophagales bacterium]
MNLDQEIILLYAEEDDQPIEGGLKGWVSNFHKFLDTLLSQIIKGDPQIKLVTEKGFSESTISNTAVVIAVMTPNLAKASSLMV